VLCQRGLGLYEHSVSFGLRSGELVSMGRCASDWPLY
jgi:hypothetical protein